jgi:glycosyltransferase involved in cell wall biosynthesis
MKIVIYHKYIPKVGGIESAIYYLAEALGKEGYDVTLAYDAAENIETILKYTKVANVVNALEEEIECDVCLVASNHQISKNIKAKKFLQWVHSDYNKYGLRLENKENISEFICVTEYVEKTIRELEDIKNTTVIYNFPSDNFKRKTERLKLVTVSRVSPEKGFGRMLKLAEILKKKEVDFIWFVLGDNSHYPREYENWVNKFRHIEEVCFVGYKNNVRPFLSEADYLVQLSDWEGCPLSVLEALKMQVPCIVTNWGGADEIIKDGKNGYILPMEVEAYPQYVDKIVDKIPKVEYRDLSTVKDWVKLIEN